VSLKLPYGLFLFYNMLLGLEAQVRSPDGAHAVVSNKSGNLLFAQSYPEQYENVGFVHRWCTVEFHQKSDRVNPSLRLRGMNANFDGFPTRL